MRSVIINNVEGIRANARHDALDRLQFVFLPATAPALLVPGRVAVVAEHQLRTDSRHFPAGARRLYVAEIAEGIDQAIQSLSNRRIIRALLAQTQNVENLAACCHQPAQSICEGEGYALTRTLI